MHRDIKGANILLTDDGSVKLGNLTNLHILTVFTYILFEFTNKLELLLQLILECQHKSQQQCANESLSLEHHTGEAFTLTVVINRY